MATRQRGRPRGSNRITYAEAAAICGVTKTTIARWVRDGVMPAYETERHYHQLWRDVVLEVAADNKRNESRSSVDMGPHEV